MQNPGFGGNSAIMGQVKHHNKPILQVFIKYGSSIPQKIEPNSFDASAQADHEGHFSFDELMPGEYYLHGTGYDSLASSFVKGGIAISICADENLSIDIPVSE